MLLANFDRKEHLQHRAVSLRQHGFLVLIVFDIFIFSLHFYFNVYLLYVAHVSYIIKRIWYGMTWFSRVYIQPAKLPLLRTDCVRNNLPPNSVLDIRHGFLLTQWELRQEMLYKVIINLTRWLTEKNWTILVISGIQRHREVGTKVASLPVTSVNCSCTNLRTAKDTSQHVNINSQQ